MPSSDLDRLPDLTPHIFSAGPNQAAWKATEPPDPSDLRKKIEPWLTAVFQSEHLSLLVGNGLTSAIMTAIGESSASMSPVTLDSDFAPQIEKYAAESAMKAGRGEPNFEDQLRAGVQLRDGLSVLEDPRTKKLTEVLDTALQKFMRDILCCERLFASAEERKRQEAERLLVSFLMAYASRVPSRERLNLFTTNYDRFIEFGADSLGLHIVDRFVGALSPVFRSSRLSIDMHYNPPGIRGEPRYLEGVIRFAKLHGSLDWRYHNRELRRIALPFGAPDSHPAIPDKPSETAMIYPNAAKDTETANYPYAELFRDFASATCKPNASLVTYGYGFGDDHVNRVIEDMLTIPSTHLVIIAWDRTKPSEESEISNASRKRIMRFCHEVGRTSQITLLLGEHFGDLTTLVESYLPKPAIDYISIRRARIDQLRGEGPSNASERESDEHPN